MDALTHEDVNTPLGFHTIGAVVVIPAGADFSFATSGLPSIDGPSLIVGFILLPLVVESDGHKMILLILNELNSPSTVLFVTRHVKPRARKMFPMVT